MGMQQYFAQLRALELSATFSAPPKASVVNRWKTEAPANSLAIAAPWVVSHRKAPLGAKGWASDATSGEFRDSPAVRTALAELSQICGQLSPWAVVFTSPALFSPSTFNREKLRQFFAEVAPAELFAGAKRVWVPDGLWEPLSAVRFASELGVTCAIDPLVQIPGMPPDLHLHYETSDLYFRILAIGRNRGLREDDFISLEELSAIYEDADFIFATMERWKDAKNSLQRLSAEAPPVDPIERMTRRTGGAALAFQRPASTTLTPGTSDDENSEFEDEDFEEGDDDEDADEEDADEEGADEEGADGAVAEGEDDEDDDEDDDDDDDDDDDEAEEAK